ncbi:hypothetical protein AGLY_017296 [Aphis glycines]|uniref:HAT C-terminal dimerisation domain-containing protein n=1 Tax=Aphis glycines TaxID=307491 RepID=A0A6G0SW36_APHGL|nr:hypothetical protein AGLY_017296 [Aphis glycines]
MWMMQGFVDVSEKQDSQTLADTILNFLSQLNLHNVPIIAQSYDGGRVIMNLVVLDLCNNIECSNIFFNGIESLYVHFARTSNNKKLKDMQQIIGIKASTIMRISDTRWVCRYNNCKPVKDNYAAILKILIEEIYNNNDMDVAQAIGIQNDIIPVVDNNIFPNFYKLLQTALTIPISTASCERSFSVMRRIKNWTRNTLTNDRFTNMSILHIERDLSHEIESENITTPRSIGSSLQIYTSTKIIQHISMNTNISNLSNFKRHLARTHNILSHKPCNTNNMLCLNNPHNDNFQLHNDNIIMRNVTQIDETCDGASKKDQCLPKENHNSFNLITAINLIHTSAYNLNKWLSDNNMFHQVQQFTINEEINLVSVSGETVYNDNNIKGIILPLQFQFKAFFESDDNLNKTLTHDSDLMNVKDASIKKFVQGSLWKEKISQYQNKIVVPYFIFCKAKKSKTHNLCEQDSTLLRNHTNYLEDIDRNDFKGTGIYKNSILNNIASFHVVKNYSIGAVNFFTLDVLNFRKQHFNYGSIEFGNISPPIKMSHLKKLHLNMSAREMMTFVYFFSLMVGDLVPEDDEVWKFFLIVLEIIEILLSGQFTQSLVFH